MQELTFVSTDSSLPAESEKVPTSPGSRVAVQCDTTALSGIFHDLTMDGTMLLLDDSGQTRHITTGDVKLLGS